MSQQDAQGLYPSISPGSRATRPSRDDWAMSVARLTAERATCLRRKVGCVLLNARGHVLATGYNGVAAGQPHCDHASIVHLASVPRSPGPGPWQPILKFYLDRAAKLYPELVKKMGRLEPYNIGPSTVEGCVSVVAKRFPHACVSADAPSGQQLEGCHAIHAEQNALLQCRDVYSIHTAYVTTSPCMTCTKLLLNTSCEQIVFGEHYAHAGAQSLWEGSGRRWVHYKEG